MLLVKIVIIKFKGILGNVWCLIVSIPDLCPLSYFYSQSFIDIPQRIYHIVTAGDQITFLNNIMGAEP